MTTLTEVLATRGISHARDELTENDYRHTWSKDGKVIGRFDAHEGWDWLATEPTEQYVIPGCEKDKTRGPVQPDLF